MKAQLFIQELMEFLLVMGEGTRLSLWISLGVKGEESPGFHVFCSCLLVSYTVEPPNKGHSGTSHFVHYREVVLFLEI